MLTLAPANSGGFFRVHLEHGQPPDLIHEWDVRATFSGHFFNFNDVTDDGGVVDTNRGEFHLLTGGYTFDGGGLDNLQVWSERERTQQLLNYPMGSIGCRILGY